MRENMKIYYIFDAYCGWCYGFEEVLKAFDEAHPELEINVISGGLFTEGNPISAYPHMEGANRRIADIFGVTFGEEYVKLLREGSMVPDSNDAAIGFGVLREMLPTGEQVKLAARVQKAFYQEGRSLSDTAIYKEIAAEYGISTAAVEKRFEEEKAMGNYHPDFYTAQSYGVSSFPTLIAEVNGKLYDLKGSAMSLKSLEKNLAWITKDNQVTTEETSEVLSACRLDGSGCMPKV